MKTIAIILCVFCQLAVFAQKRTADRYFKKGDYINATKYYEQYLDRYKHTKEVTQNIADAYYKIYDFRKARFYLEKLIEGRFSDKDKTYENRYNFKMYNILSALGNHEKAIDFLAIYKKNQQKKFDKKLAIETVEQLKLKTNDYKTNRLFLSSDNAEFGAVRVRDSLFFVSDRTETTFGTIYKWTHKPFLNIYKAPIYKGKVLSTKIKDLPKNINSTLHEGNFCFSKDGKTLYFSRSNIIKNKKKFDTLKVNNVQLFKSIKINEQWSKPEKLAFCKDGFSYQHPALNYEENRLYFSSNETNNNENFDIFFVEIDGNNEQYGDLVNLGTTINTENREHFPYISKDGHLFFASNGHLGLGMLDIFVSENVNGKFTNPINLGAPINSKYDDFSLNYYNNSEGYFASNRKFLNDDIYKFTQIGEIFIREYLVNFEVRDVETNKLVNSATSTVINRKRDTIYNNKTAKFTMNLIPNSYTFLANANEYIGNQTQISTNEKGNQKYVIYLSKKPKPIVDSVKTTKKEPVIVTKLNQRKTNLLKDKDGPKIIIKNNEMYFDMPPIYFEFDKWTITQESKKVLNKLAEKLERHPKIYIEISSHTDSRGTAKYNQFLSEKRAEATRNYLALIGYVNARRMQFKGFGESQPIFDCKQNCTEEQHQTNRRSEFKIVKY